MKVIYSLEDDLDIQKILNVSLKKVGYDIYSFSTASSFIEAFYKKKPDMCLLDLMLGDANGMDVLKKIRSNNIYDDVEIIIISAKRMTLDKIEGLDNGADDYIEKPFDILELISRVNARFRKSKSVLSFSDIKLIESSHTVFKGDKAIDLTNMEYEILRILLTHKSSVIKREEINQALYQTDNTIESRSIDMHVASLRKKLDDKNGSIIKTVYGVGYIIG